MQTFSKYNTPWGNADHVKHIGGGIVAVQTPGHGGYFVPDSMLAKMPENLKCNTYVGGNWFEEDCEWALVCAAFPGYFDPRVCLAAYRTIQAYSGCKSGQYFQPAVAWLKDGTRSGVLRDKAAEWRDPAGMQVAGCALETA